MKIPQEIKQQACEALFHFYPKKRLAQELGVSKGSIRDWSILIANNNYDWLHHPGRQNREPLRQAVEYWFDAYPIGYSDVARAFGVRPATLHRSIQRHLDKLPIQLRPKRIRFWDSPAPSFIGDPAMPFEKLSDIPADRPLTASERKALMQELRDARDRLICAESLLEVAVETCKDELKKKELQRQLELTRKALQSFVSVD